MLLLASLMSLSRLEKNRFSVPHKSSWKRRSYLKNQKGVNGFSITLPFQYKTCCTDSLSKYLSSRNQPHRNMYIAYHLQTEHRYLRRAIRGKIDNIHKRVFESWHRSTVDNQRAFAPACHKFSSTAIASFVVFILCVRTGVSLSSNKEILVTDRIVSRRGGPPSLRHGIIGQSLAFGRGKDHLLSLFANNSDISWL